MIDAGKDLVRKLNFSVDEYVVYGSEGVCRVEQIGHPNIAGLDSTKEYYTLMPVYKSGRIYAPIDSLIPMRPAMDAETAKELISEMPHMPSRLDVPPDSKEAAAFYKSLVRTYECRKLISIVKHVQRKQRELACVKKNVSAADMKFMKIARDMICGELGFSLGVSPKDVRERLESRCRERLADAMAAEPAGQ